MKESEALGLDVQGVVRWVSTVGSGSSDGAGDLAHLDGQRCTTEERINAYHGGKAAGVRRRLLL